MGVLPVQARVGQLAARLRARLEPFVAGNAGGFEQSHAREAQKLAEAAFGEAMLHTIGCVCFRCSLAELFMTSIGL